MAGDIRDSSPTAPSSGQPTSGGAAGGKMYDVFPQPNGNSTNGPGGSAGPAGEHRMPTLTDAFQTVKLEDFTQVHKYPCSREALLTGIGAGFGVGGLRGILGAPMSRAANWAVGGFMLGGIISYEYCMYKRRVEKEYVKRALEIMDRKRIEKEEQEKALKKRRAEAEAARVESERKKTWWKLW